MLKKIISHLEQLKKTGLSLYRELLRYIKDGGKKISTTFSATKKLPLGKKLTLLAVVAVIIYVVQLIFKSDESKKEASK